MYLVSLILTLFSLHALASFVQPDISQMTDIQRAPMYPPTPLYYPGGPVAPPQPFQQQPLMQPQMQEARPGQQLPQPQMQPQPQYQELRPQPLPNQPIYQQVPQPQMQPQPQYQELRPQPLQQMPQQQMQQMPQQQMQQMPQQQMQQMPQQQMQQMPQQQMQQMPQQQMQQPRPQGQVIPPVPQFQVPQRQEERNTGSVIANVPVLPDFENQEALAVVYNQKDKNLRWVPCRGPYPKGCEVSVLHGDFPMPESDYYVRIPSLFELKPHIQTSTSHTVLIEGKARMKYLNQKEFTLNRGNFVFLPPDMPRFLTCVSKEPCVFFVHFDKPSRPLPYSGTI